MRVLLGLLPLMMAVDACQTARDSGISAEELQLNSYYDLQVGGTAQAGASFNLYFELPPGQRAVRLDSLRLRDTTLALMAAPPAGQYRGLYFQKQPVQPLEDSVDIYLEAEKARGWLRIPPPELRRKIFMPSAHPGR